MSPARPTRISRNVVKLFAQLFPGRRFGGGALSVYIDGVPVVDVWTGWSDRAGTQRWTADTGAMVFSATKGVASTVIHRLADRGLLSYDEPVAEYWPEFAANGKGEITVRDVLRHRSGLSHLRGVTKAQLMDHALMEERLAAAPVDHLRGVQAYHALTYGWLLSGLARAVTGKGMRELIRQEVARPLNTDGLHLGRPPEGSPTKPAEILIPHGRLRTPVFNFIAPKVAGLPFSGALGAMYFPGVVSLIKGDTPFLDGEVPAANGVVTGRGLAKMYAVLANDGRIDGKKYLSEELARGLAGQSRRKWPDANMVVPMPFHLGLPRIAGPRLAARFRPRRSRRDARLGRPRSRQRVRFRPQPAADAVAVRHGILCGPGPSAAQRHRGRPPSGPAAGAATRRHLRQARPAQGSPIAGAATKFAAWAVIPDCTYEACAKTLMLEPLEHAGSPSAHMSMVFAAYGGPIGGNTAPDKRFASALVGLPKTAIAAT